MTRSVQGPLVYFVKDLCDSPGLGDAPDRNGQRDQSPVHLRIADYDNKERMTAAAA